MCSTWLLWQRSIERFLNAPVIARSSTKAGGGVFVFIRLTWASARRVLRYGLPMRLFASPLVRSLLLLVVFIPSWSTVPRLPLLGKEARFAVEPVSLYPASPMKRRLGALIFERGYRLTSPDPTFGGFSSLMVDGDRFTLLSDGGNIVRFRLSGDGRLSGRQFAELTQGPGTGWEKSDRDSESMTRDPVTGHVWVGFENHNAIWAYQSDLRRVLRHAEPAVMRHWPSNGGPEALARLRDGRFIVLGETAYWPRGQRRDHAGVMFEGDPTRRNRRGYRFGYRPPADFKPTDVAALPDGRLVVLNRRFGWPAGFSAALTLIDPNRITPGSVASGTEIARFEPPSRADNFEGIAVVQEKSGATSFWIVADDNQMPFQQSLLLKFRLDDSRLRRTRRP